MVLPAKGGTAISVFVRDDRSGGWSTTTLLPGPHGGRKVPRDMLVHKDSITGVSRLFLLCGDSGVISGTYHPSQSPRSRRGGGGGGTIVWEAEPERIEGVPRLASGARGFGSGNNTQQAFWTDRRAAA